MRPSKSAWERARLLYETDFTATFNSLAAELGCSKQAVRQRAKREEWVKATNDALKVVEDNPIVETSDKATPELLAQFINAMSLLRNEQLACQLVGVDPSTVRRWRDKDERFARQVAQARARKVFSWVDTVDRAACKDYKAALELLKRMPETRETFGESQDSGTKIILNISRS